MEVRRRADTYFGRQSANLIKEFWTLCILLITDFETVMVETIPYLNLGIITDPDVDSEESRCPI